MKHIGNLQKPEGLKKKRKRIGRGTGSGYGRTSTKGHKGQKSRSGFKQIRGFEGGQMPLNRRVPKFGFFNRFRTKYQIVNIQTLQSLADNNALEGSEVNFKVLNKLGVISNKRLPLKILGNGEITSALNVVAHKFSNSAKEKIESVGGTVTIHG